MFNSLILKNPTNVYKRRFPSFLDDSWFYEDAKSFLPKANIIEKEKEYLVEVEVPGVKKEDVDISVKDNVLTVRGERKKKKRKMTDIILTNHLLVASKNLGHWNMWNKRASMQNLKMAFL